MAYMGFKNLEASLAGKVRNPGAVAASIGRKKYGADKFNKAAAQGKSMKGMEPMESHMPTGCEQTPMGNIGAHRQAEAHEVGTFKKTGGDYRPAFKNKKPNQTFYPPIKY